MLKLRIFYVEPLSLRSYMIVNAIGLNCYRNLIYHIKPLGGNLMTYINTSTLRKEVQLKSTKILLKNVSRLLNSKYEINDPENNKEKVPKDYIPLAKIKIIGRTLVLKEQIEYPEDFVQQINSGDINLCELIGCPDYYCANHL